MFVVIALAIYQGLAAITEAMRVSRLKVIVAALANEQFEIIRNLPYADVGLVNGVPPGKLLRSRLITRNGIEFSVITTVRNIDDPFDGTIGGTPNDLSPADYKLVALDISCTTCRDLPLVSFTTYVAPLGLETASTNGALFVRVFDANGQPIPGANVHIENNQQSPPIVIDDVTDGNGYLQIVDAPPGTEAYEINVSKSGYSSEQTYTPNEPGNPNPVKPHATVSVQQVTQISFAIDKLSAVNFSTLTSTCAAVAGVDFNLQGSKLIGTNPDVLKYSQSFSSNSNGLVNLSAMEWDTYNLDITDSIYDLAGAIPTLPLTVIPDSTQDVKLIVRSKNPKSLLVTVLDASTQLPISDASVTLSAGGYNQTLVTGRGFLRQTDWSGGAGQTNFIDETRFFSTDGNIDIANPSGELRLRDLGGLYAPSGYVESSTFDTGSASNFHQLIWQPLDQPPAAGPESVKFQIATNNDNATWNFVGPDGTANTYYTLADSNINPIHNGDRYFRYKLFLNSADTTVTPIVSDISFTFTSSCVPPGQALFTGLSADTYDITVSKSGYQNFNDTVVISADWQQQTVVLNP